MHIQLRKIVKNRGRFPTDEGASQLLYLALRNITKDWQMPPFTWKQAANQFAILFGERFTYAMHRDFLKHTKFLTSPQIGTDFTEWRSKEVARRVANRQESLAAFAFCEQLLKWRRARVQHSDFRSLHLMRRERLLK
jgi:hypothetical protein